MPKRKLSKQQARRIKHQQKKSEEAALSSPSRDNSGKRLAQSDYQDSLDEQLGPEQLGTVIAHYGTQVEVEDSTTQDTFRCHVRANIKNLVTGDYVVWQASSDNEGVVVSVQQRTTALFRPDNYGNLKPVAANIDQLIITIAPQPEPTVNFIDRYIALAENFDIKPLILINKCELIESPPPPYLNEIRTIYKKLGYAIIEVSCKQRLGFDKLKAQLANATSIFVGQSGVGKSSIIQHLLPNENIRVGDISKAIKQGRHTTTYSRLYHFSTGGSCIDSPGIREYGLWHLTKEQVIYGFIELRDLATNCKFRNCQHDAEPGCAIQDALKSKKVFSQRVDSFKRILATLDDVRIRKQ